MKKILLTLLAIVLVLGLFAATGYAGYRFGYAQGVQATNDNVPQFGPFENFGPRGMPMHNFGLDREVQRGFRSGRFPMMGFGFFSPLRLLGRIAVLALIIWFIYWLFTQSGWRLTRQTTESSSSQTKNE